LIYGTAAVKVIVKMFYVGVLEAAGNLLLLVILWRGLTEGMLRKYSVFYGYIGCVLLCSLTQIFLKAAYGLWSDQYYYAFYLPPLLWAVLQVWILHDIYQRVVGNTKISWQTLTLPAIVVTVVAVMAWLKVSSMASVDPFYRFHAISLPVQVMIALMVFHRLNTYILPGELGRNLSGILLGISLIVAPQTINFTSYLFLGESYALFAFLLQFGFFVALAVFCFGLWEYAPMRRLQPAAQAQLAKLDGNLHQVVKVLLLKK
jgi:hypothetical protein